MFVPVANIVFMIMFVFMKWPIEAEVEASWLASVSVDVESKRIGKTPDTIERGDLPLIATNLIAALRLVVGNEMAEAAARKVRELA